MKLFGLFKPSKIIGVNYLMRWHIIPRNRFLNVYLHRFTGSDDSRAMHDHPWWSVSFLLKGGVMELQKNKRPRHPRWMVPVIRRPDDAHRLVHMGPPCWTLFITGPVVRDWGFHCPRGWQHWRTMTDEKGNQIGGCD